MINSVHSTGPRDGQWPGPRRIQRQWQSVTPKYTPGRHQREKLTSQSAITDHAVQENHIID